MEYKYRVIASQMITPTTLAITLHADGGKAGFPYQPGQYAALSFKNHARPTPARCFSMTSSPRDMGWLQFAMRVKGDYTSTAARHIHPGDEVTVEGPFGGFIMRPYRDQMAVLLAGGIGITPFMSMARYAASFQLSTDILLVYSCKTQDDIPFVAELTALEQQNPRFHVLFVIGDGPVDRLAGRYVARGRITGELLDNVLGRYYQGRTYFICGPLPFMESLEHNLRSRGVPKRRIMTESFSQQLAPKTSLLLGRPPQIYALTALSLVLGTGAVIEHDLGITRTALKGAVQMTKDNGAVGNSRETAVDQAIGSLQDGSPDAGQPDGPTTIGGPASDPLYDPSVSGPVIIPAAPGSVPNPGPSPLPGNPGPSPSNPAPAPSPVPGPRPSPTPSPTPSPAAIPPAIRFGSNANTIRAGSTATLSWSVNADATQPVACNASGGWSGSKPASGSQAVSPTSTTTYVLGCSNVGGGASAQVTITVLQPSSPPPSNPPPPPPSSGGS